MIGLSVGHRFQDDQRALAEKRVYEQSFLQAFDLWPHYPAIAEFVQCFRFADVARRMMAVEGVKLWFDQALYKEPGGRITDYHVDAAFWPAHPAANTTTIWMALVDVPREKGCMAFAAGSHKLSPTPNLSISSMRKRRSRSATTCGIVSGSGRRWSKAIAPSTQDWFIIAPAATAPTKSARR